MVAQQQEEFLDAKDKPTQHVGLESLEDAIYLGTLYLGSPVS